MSFQLHFSASNGSGPLYVEQRPDGHSFSTAEFCKMLSAAREALSLPPGSGVWVRHVSEQDDDFVGAIIESERPAL